MEYEINKWHDAIKSGEYQGKTQITLGYMDKSGAFRPKFIAKKDGSVLPASITFDTFEDAAGVLETILREVKSKIKTTDDVPF